MILQHLHGLQGNKKRRLGDKEHMDIIDEFCAAVQVMAPSVLLAKHSVRAQMPRGRTLRGRQCASILMLQHRAPALYSEGHLTAEPALRWQHT